MQSKFFHRNILIIFIGAICLPATGCRPVNRSKSQLNNLGTLQAGDNNSRVSTCGKSSTTSSALDGPLQALPKRLADEFSDTKKYFRLEPNVDSICRKVLANVAGLTKGEIEACWEIVQEPNQQVSYPRIVLKNDANAISRHIIATTTKAYGEFFIDGILGPASDQAVTNGTTSLRVGEQQMRDFIVAFRNARKALTQAFLADLGTSNNRSIIETYGKTFQSTSGALSESLPFQNYVLGEFMDSYYCNETTVKDFNANYLVRTRGTFLPFVDMFGAPWYVQK